MLVPSIDIMNNKAVKLVQGSESSKKYETDAIELANKYSVFPLINVIDLDAAMGKGNNTDLIKKLCKICRCNVGGGIRTREKAIDLLKAGANKLIIGTRAEKEFLKTLPKEKIIIALDSRRGKIVTSGWKNATEKTPLELAEELEPYCSEFLYTYVDREGTMQGIDIETVKKLKAATKNKLSYAGGIGSMDEVKTLENLSVDSVLGMSVYEGRIDPIDGFISLLKFDDKGLIPTIVQNENWQVLMMAYSNKESLQKAMAEKNGWYYSRSRKKLWKKGETSGNTQELIRVFPDCDKDTLLFIVKQKGAACHTGSYSCFMEREFTVNELYNVIANRKENPVKGSYTNMLLEDENEIMAKIKEESLEVINYRNKENLRWEIADLLYFINVLMAKKSLTPKDIENELLGKHAVGVKR